MRKNIVILGAGFGGLRTATQLDKKIKKLGLESEYQIILIDRSDYHTFPPLLYEIAATSKETADYVTLKSLVTYPLVELLENTNIKLINDEILHIDLLENQIHLSDKSKIKFDYVVIALGVNTNFFNIPGLEKNSLQLKTFTDALKIRDTIWSLFLDRKDLPADAKNLSVLIGGAGATGVELAGEIKEWASELEIENKEKCQFEVSIIEGNQTILPGFDHKIIEKATERLKELGVKLINNEKIIKVIEKAVVLESGRIVPFDIFIWTGGTKANTITKKLPLKLDLRDRIEVMDATVCIPDKPDLKTSISNQIYAIGDIACLLDGKTQKPIPQMARPAIDQANIVVKNIIENIKSEKGIISGIKVHNYKFKNYPYIISVGGKFAVAKFGPFVIYGFHAWFLKGLVDLNYLISIMPFAKAFKIWLRGLLIFIRNDRLG